MFEGHGDHWNCIIKDTEDKKAALTHIQRLLKESRVLWKTKQIVTFGDEESELRDVFAIVYGHGPLEEMALIAEHKGCNELITGYPYLTEGTKLSLKIKKIEEWSNGIEAVVTGEYGEGDDSKEFCFFDTHYFENKEIYKIDSVYDFRLSFVAYYAEKLKETSFSFEGQQAIDFLSKIGKAPDFDEQGKVKPVTIGLSKLVSLIADDNDDPADVEFQSPVMECDTIELDGQTFYKLSMQVYNECEPPVCLPLLAKADFFDQKPGVDDPVRGKAWLQGFMCKE